MFNEHYAANSFYQDILHDLCVVMFACVSKDTVVCDIIPIVTIIYRLSDSYNSENENASPMKKNFS